MLRCVLPSLHLPAMKRRNTVSQFRLCPMLTKAYNYAATTATRLDFWTCYWSVHLAVHVL